MEVEGPASLLDMPPPPEWGCEALGDLIDPSRGITYGIVQPGKQDSAGIPIVRVNDIRRGRIDTDNVLRVSPQIEARYERTRLKGGEILLSLVGTLGECAIVPQSLAGWNVARAVAVITVKEGVDPKWVAACLRSRPVQHLMQTWATTTVQATLNLRDVRRLPIVLPPAAEIEKIVQFTSALEDKIDLIRRGNRSLEATGRAVFKAWFTDFEPIRAKAAGAAGFRGMPQRIFERLPNQMIESRVGSIPYGWDVVSIYDVSQVIYGAPFKSKLFNAVGDGKPLLRIRDLSTHAPQVFTPEQHPRGTLVQPGDIVVGMDGEFRAHLWRGPESWMNQRVCMFRPRDRVPRAFVHYSIEPTLSSFERSKIGTTVIHLGKGDIDTFVALRPPDDILTAFGELVDPIDAKIVRSAQESRTLSEIRDTLLPRLISGETRVPDAIGPSQ